MRLGAHLPLADLGAGLPSATDLPRTHEWPTTSAT